MVRSHSESSDPALDTVLGRVLSVNVGRPREVSWKNTTVRTGFFKSPVAGRVKLVNNNLEGDGQADRVSHGGSSKAVFLYSHEYYEAWSEWLGRTPDLGMFGENLTVEGFSEEDVAIGDLLQIGSTQLRVTEPRQPCYKVDVRLGVDGAAVHMVRTGAIGCYLGIVQRGDIGAGDVIRRIDGPSQGRISPARLHRLTSNPSLEDHNELEDLTRNPNLPESWRELVATKLAGLLRRKERANRAWSGFRAFTVERIVQESLGVRSVYLGPADEGPVRPLFPGQFVTLRLPGPEPVGPSIDRSYTVSGQSERFLRISVRLSDQSQGGSARVHALNVGDQVNLRAPAGDFTTERHPAGAHAVLVSAGIGITPINVMAAALLGNAASITALHGMRSAGDDALVRELADSVVAASGRLVLNIGDGSRHPLAVEQRVGRIGHDLLASAVLDATNTHVYICGPGTFAADVRANFRAIGVPDNAIHDEGFVSPSGNRVKFEVPDGGREVYFTQNSRTVLWMDPDETLADLADVAEAEVQTSCGQGVCGTCVTRVVEGEVNYVREPARAVPDGWCLPCVAVPSTNLTLDA